MVTKPLTLEKRARKTPAGIGPPGFSRFSGSAKLQL